MASDQQESGTSSDADEGTEQGAPPSLPYLDNMSEFMRSSTDVVLVVEGTELPCHLLTLAQHSRVFSDLADSLARPRTEGMHSSSSCSTLPMADEKSLGSCVVV